MVMDLERVLSGIALLEGFHRVPARAGMTGILRAVGVWRGL
ncbi:hypothetical protein [Thermococcus atlanticus]